MKVDIIGEAPAISNAVRNAPSPNAARMLDALAQGLVRFDENGEIEPALAQRWAVLDDGLTYIFRLDDVRWPDGTSLSSGQIARQLRNAQRNGNSNRLSNLLGDIEDINAVTPEILEITLARPRIDFLQLLAQPELAILINDEGLGPLIVAEGYSLDNESTILLSPYRSPLEEGDVTVRFDPVSPNETVELRFSPAMLAVARFQLGQSNLVLGGDWTSLGYAEASDPAEAELQIDPTEGLFGLAFVEESGFLADADNRQLLSMAIDRERLAEFLDREDAEPQLLIVPMSTVDRSATLTPPWTTAALDTRRAFARTAIDRWQAQNGTIPALRIALPDAPGSRIIFAALRLDMQAIGIDVELVNIEENADLRLIDRVAATDSASWYLDQFRCGRGFVCSEEFSDALENMETGFTDRVRNIRLAEAISELERMAPIIPLLRPIRWSLVSPRIDSFTPNRHASHPLNRLVDPSS